MGHRVFVAVALPEAVREDLAAFLEPREGMPWVDPVQWHLTLAFTASVPPARADELVERLAHVAGRAAPFALSLGGAGAFPHAGRASVLWLGVDDAAQNPLARLSRGCSTRGGQTPSSSTRSSSSRPSSAKGRRGDPVTRSSRPCRSERTRSLRRASGPEGLRAALEASWARVLDRVATMPAGTVDASVDDEWSFAQTLRHLVMATDTWLGRAVLGLHQPYHPLGQPHAEYETDGYDMSVFATRQPTYEEVLEARAGRQRMVREHLATLTDDDLARPRANPWAPQRTRTTLSCLRTILDEEWEHQRYAVRDLDLLEARSVAEGQPTNMQKG
ncbi:RNA 2',3'-cyclic phosphodiesterase [Janibacter melonis]|uniref:RNA 2',3'-cyclic phosphodiesterase n=1 Tax=Janibacter melonis TaxID=262209 RepID=UPI002043D1B7|nr:RNA 2',3'-cyclic phosphodiesterase [Janibacter melonis]MCM3555281.1 RNA 2',3'-cyclic phosphodiesterase [Janibacter melonis]